MPAQRGVVVGRGLAYGERRVVPVGVQLELGGEGVDAGRLQPLGGPLLELTAGRALERPEQVAELGVGVLVVVEVLLQAGQEVVDADPEDQLLEHAGALGVGDAVEVRLDGLQVVVVRRDRVGARQLVLAQRPVLAGVGEAGPRLRERGVLHGGVVAGPLGERLVEPEVVPPLHGHQVAEPHVRHLVQDHRAAELVERLVLAAAGEVLVAQRHAAGVLHRAHVVLRHVELVVLLERVRVAEGLLEELEALLGQQHDLVAVEVLDQRLAAVVAERDGAVLALVGVEHLVVLTGDHRGDVGRHRLGGRELPHRHPALSVDGGRGHRLGRRGVGDDLPVGGGGDGERERRLQVRLLERRVDPAGVGHLELRVEVDPVVGGVEEPVQSLTRARVGAVRAHGEHVLLAQPGQRDPAVGVRRGVDRLAVQRDLVDLRADQVGERVGAGLAAAELDGGRRRERRALLVRGAGEVQVDGVRRHGEQGRAGSGLLPGQVGSRHGGDPATAGTSPSAGIGQSHKCVISKSQA